MKQMRKLVAIGLAVAMLCVAGLCGCESKDTSSGNEGTVSGKEEPTVGGKEEPKECNHSYSTQIVGATCTERGYTIYTCKLCGDSYKNNYVDALGHSYTEKEVAGTCVQKGYTLHSCTRCGNSYQDNETGYSKHKGVGTCSVCKGNILLLFMGYCVEEGIISTEGNYWIKINDVVSEGNSYSFSVCYDTQENAINFMVSSTTKEGYQFVLLIVIDKIDGVYPYAFYTNMVSASLDQGISGQITASTLKSLSQLPYSKSTISSAYASLIPTIRELGCSLAKLMISNLDLYCSLNDVQFSSANFGFSS